MPPTYPPYWDDEPEDDYGPTPDQEAAWDAREDDLRGHALADPWDDGPIDPAF